MSDFSDKPFVAGSLVGLRAFKVDRLGRLVSPSYPTVFRPGENVAECKTARDDIAAFKCQMDALNAQLAAIDAAMGKGRRRKPGPPPSARPADRMPKPHHVGQLDCTCGWYAYTDGSNDYLTAADLWTVPRFGGAGDGLPRIAAIVEGYGTCTVGDRGFRAEKARLLAIVSEDFQGSQRHVLDGRMQRMTAAYKGVPVIDSLLAALGEFPLSATEVPTPESHGDDFWTLEVAR